MEKSKFIWMNGEVVPWEEAKVHVLTHALHYGSGVFEGIRAYKTDLGPAIFRHRAHLERLERSANLYHIDLPFSLDVLQRATHDLIRQNRLESCYIRPLVYRGYGEMGLNPLGAPVEAVIAVWPWGAYLGEDGKRDGIRTKVSSWHRIGPGSLIPWSKACGQYLNSILAKVEASEAGYQEAILLDEKGNVCEGTGENIFLVKDGKVSTPTLDSSILPGITRDSVIKILSDLGNAVDERDIASDELFSADEVFLTGTAAEIVPVREIDDRKIGEPGAITREVQDIYQDAIFGRRSEYLDWLDVVEQKGHAEAVPERG